jgi:hypothetical protein
VRSLRRGRHRRGATQPAASTRRAQTAPPWPSWSSSPAAVVAADLKGSEAAAAATMTWPVPDADLKSAEKGRKRRGASDREMGTEEQPSRAVCLLGCEGAQLFFWQQGAQLFGERVKFRRLGWRLVFHCRPVRWNLNSFFPVDWYVLHGPVGPKCGSRLGVIFSIWFF